MTLPTGDMLSSILQTSPTFGDDVFSEDEPTNSLERYMEGLTGLKNGIFVLSGTMGNQIALRCLLTQPPYSVILDRRSHIFEYECGMASMFSQAQLIPVIPRGTHLSLEDITPNIVPDDGDTHGSPTRVIALENTCWGKIMPLHEVQKISQYAHTRGIKIHLDGARLWNACYGPAVTHIGDSDMVTTKAVETLKAYCAEVDTVSLCFSKSLGAPVGSILLARDTSLLARGRHFRKALGGGMRQTGVLTSAARAAVDQIFLTGNGLLRANTLAKRLQDSWVSKGGHIQQDLEQETNMVWIDLKKAHVMDEEFVRIAEQVGVKVFDGRIVTHHRKFPIYYTSIWLSELLKLVQRLQRVLSMPLSLHLRIRSN